MNTAEIEVKNLYKSFIPAISLGDIAGMKFHNRVPQPALTDISFCLSKGNLLAVLGENGAGKTTLLNIISSLILPDSGTVRLNGRDISSADTGLKSKLGFMFSEERSFYWRLTGRQNLEFFAALYGLNKTQAAQRIDKLMDKFKITYAEKRFSDFSTGMKKIFALLRALIHEPSILLLDEPAKSLDLEKKALLVEIITRLKQEGKTIIISTHDFSFAETAADKFIFLHNGYLKAEGSLSRLRTLVSSPQSGLEELYRKAVYND